MSTKLYITLLHGRKSPTEELASWGFDGPIIGPCSWVHWTYGDIRFGAEDYSHESWLNINGGTVELDGKYYGDFDISAEPPCKLEQHRLMSIQDYDWMLNQDKEHESHAKDAEKSEQRAGT